MSPLKRDEFFENVKLKDLLIEITNSFEEISDKKFLIKSDDNILDPTIKRKAEITYGLRNFIGNASKFSDTKVEINLESNEEITKIRNTAGKEILKIVNEILSKYSSEKEISLIIEKKKM